MRRKIVGLGLVLAFFMGGCDDDGSFEVREESFSLDSSDTLTVSLGLFGDEEGASISLEPQFHELSKTVRGTPENDSEVVYLYKARQDFAGSDYVEITARRGSDGASIGNEVVLWKLTILVDN